MNRKQALEKAAAAARLPSGKVPGSTKQTFAGPTLGSPSPPVMASSRGSIGNKATQTQAVKAVSSSSGTSKTASFAAVGRVASKLLGKAQTVKRVAVGGAKAGYQGAGQGARSRVGKAAVSVGQTARKATDLAKKHPVAAGVTAGVVGGYGLSKVANAASGIRNFVSRPGVRRAAGLAAVGGVAAGSHEIGKRRYEQQSSVTIDGPHGVQQLRLEASKPNIKKIVKRLSKGDQEGAGELAKKLHERKALRPESKLTQDEQMRRIRTALQRAYTAGASGSAQEKTAALPKAFGRVAKNLGDGARNFGDGLLNAPNARRGVENIGRRDAGRSIGERAFEAGTKVRASIVQGADNVSRHIPEEVRDLADLGGRRRARKALITGAAAGAGVGGAAGVAAGIGIGRRSREKTAEPRGIEGFVATTT